VYPLRRSPWIPFGLALALGVVGAAPALAQPASSIALESRAQSLYQRGRERFSSGDFEQARLAFQSSLDTVDSPNTRMYLGRTLLRLGRPADAWALLDRAARDADARAVAEPRYVPTRDAARAEADAIAPSLAWLTLDATDAPDGLAVRVNGSSLQRGGLGVTMPMQPGEVTVAASAPGRRDARVTLTLVAGQRELQTLTLEALPAEIPVAAAPPPPILPPPRQLPLPPPDRTALRDWGLVLGAVGAAAIATGVVLFSERDRTDQILIANGYDASRVEDGKLYQGLAYGTMIPGAVLAATGTAMLFVWLLSPNRPRPLTLHIGPTGVGGAF
jgi:tetratricopeptide (TPR) repeat protein